MTDPADRIARQQKRRSDGRSTDPDSFNVAPPNMPPAPAGADAQIGGEAAASRRLAGLPENPTPAEVEHADPTAAPDTEPFLGYDSLDAEDLLGWIRDADPEPPMLRLILRYESRHDRRAAVIQECVDRLDRLTG